MIEDIAGAAIEGLEVIGSFGETSPRRKRRGGCWWLSLLGLLLMAVAIAVGVILG
jgi:hypothetical protein